MIYIAFGAIGSCRWLTLCIQGIILINGPQLGVRVPPRKRENILGSTRKHFTG
jgi:hypothetical protein